MARYIDVDELVKDIKSRFCDGCYDDNDPMKCFMCSTRERFVEIINAPTADVVEVKHGEWKWDKRFSDYTCSLCGNWDLKTPNYCPNCGAKMDGGNVG